MTDNKLRCVITGIGTINAIGKNVDECWNNILSSKSGIGHTKTVDSTGCYSDYSAEVDITDQELCSELKTEGYVDRVSLLCLKACEEACADAGIDDFKGNRMASVIMGSCVGGGKSIDNYYTKEKTRERVQEMPISALANHVASRYHAGGVVTNIANACAAGTMSIAYASDLIRDGRAQIVIAGGSDSFSSVPYAGFLSLHALADGACSPFNHSNGITLGEGAGAVIVESYEHAVARGAKIYCEVLGAGISADAHHITAPRPDGQGQMYAINAAIEHSGLKSEDIDYVNAHGTGTAKNDEAEFLSLHTIFDGKGDLSVSSTKAMTGHCLGAAGAIEAVFSIKALKEGIVPPTLGYSDEDIEALKEKAGEIDFRPNEPAKKALTSVMSNSFAFGGTNASIIFSSEAGDIKLADEKQDIVITGLGIVTPLGNGKERYIAAVKAGEKAGEGAESAVGTEDYNELGIKMSFYRKLDHFSQLQAVSGMAALKDAGYEVNAGNEFRAGIIVGSSEGALASACDFQKLITEKGNAAGSAFKFPNTVYNAAGGYLSICSGLKGYNATVTNGPQSALSGAAYGAGIIRNGWADAMLVTGNDEKGEIISELYDMLGTGYDLSDGSVSVLMESRESASLRGAKSYCSLTGFGMACSGTGKCEGADGALKAAVKSALSDAGITAADIDCVYGFANGVAEIDSLENNMMTEIFAGKKSISVKERLGEGRAASAALALAHAGLMLSGQIEEDGGVMSKDIKNALVVSFSEKGSFTAIVLKKEA